MTKIYTKLNRNWFKFIEVTNTFPLLDCHACWLCRQKLYVQVNMRCMILGSLKPAVLSGTHCLRRNLSLHTLLIDEEGHPSSLSGRLLEEDRSHPCHKWGSIREVCVMLPGLTHQIDDMAEAGNMDTVWHHSFQDLPVCFQTVSGIICVHCPGIIQI